MKYSIENKKNMHFVMMPIEVKLQSTDAIYYITEIILYHHNNK